MARGMTWICSPDTMAAVAAGVKLTIVMVFLLQTVTQAEVGNSSEEKSRYKYRSGSGQENYMNNVVE
jgi:hypothetical protein